MSGSTVTGVSGVLSHTHSDYVMEGDDQNNDGPDQFILSVLYRHTATHHVVKKSASSPYFLVNDQSIGRCRTLPEVSFIILLMPL